MTPDTTETLLSADSLTLALVALNVLLLIVYKLATHFYPTKPKGEDVVGMVRQVLTNLSALVGVLKAVEQSNTSISETISVVGRLQSDLHNQIQDTRVQNERVALYLATTAEKLSTIHENVNSMPERVSNKIAAMRVVL